MNLLLVISKDLTSWAFSLSLIAFLQPINSEPVIVTTTSPTEFPEPSPAIIALVLFEEPLPINLQFSTVKLALAEIARNLPLNSDLASDISTVKFLTAATSSNLNTV